MRINEFDPGKNINQPGEKAGPADPALKALFEKALAEAQGKTGGIQQEKSAASTQETQALNAANSTANSPGNVISKVTDLLDRVLSNLDAYKNILSKPDVKLDRMNDVVSSLEQDKKALVNFLPEIKSDKALHSLVSQTAALISSESTKYHLKYQA